MRKLVWAFFGRTYHIVGYLMLRLNCVCMLITHAYNSNTYSVFPRGDPEKNHQVVPFAY